MKIKQIFKFEYIILAILLVMTAYLRFSNLGYSDYHGDEHKAFIELDDNENIFSFLLNQRKGPMQFFVTYIPYLFTHDFRNELAQRIPFALISILSGIVFYFLIKKMTKSGVSALFATALLMFNGFIVGFGRIAQYQNLNLLFSFLSLYYFYDLTYKSIIKKEHLLGSVFFCLSFLSHWDAIYIVPVILYIYVIFINRKDISKTDKLRVTKQTLVSGALMLLPFMLPYLYFLLQNKANQTYFYRRVEYGFFDINYYKVLIELYNPYLTFWFISVLAVIGSFRIKKSLPFIIWFVITFVIFTIFFKKPGTHIYNFVIPAIVLCSLAIDWFIQKLPKILKVIPLVLFTACVLFMYYQSYRYFIDTSKEYPFDQKAFIDSTYAPKYIAENKLLSSIYTKLTEKSAVYTDQDKLPLFGFPHYRYWDEINNFIKSENVKNNENCGYITNEDKVVSDWYMNAKYNDKGCFYIVGIRNPMNFVKDWYIPQYSGRTLVKQFGDKITVSRIYKITPKQQ